MSLQKILIWASFFNFFLFLVLSYTVAKEYWLVADFDATVKIQERISRVYDPVISYFSYIGSAEVTVLIAVIGALISLLKLKVLNFIGWLMIVPASIIEVFGKLTLFHPGPPVIFHRTLTPTGLPSFYIHTEFSYPSGHATRIIFLVTLFLCLVLVSVKNKILKMALILTLVLFTIGMLVTRVSLGEHWLSDVVGGAVLGFSAGLFGAALIIPKSYARMKVKLPKVSQ